MKWDFVDVIKISKVIFLNFHLISMRDTIQTSKEYSFSARAEKGYWQEMFDKMFDRIYNQMFN